MAGLGASRLTRLHCPLDDAQDVGGVSQLQPVVNSHFHFTRGGVKDMIRIKHSPVPLSNLGEREAKRKMTDTTSHMPSRDPEKQ